MALRGLAFATMTEVTFSEWGERGSIDVFAHNRELEAVVVGEAKSEWGSVEETLRALDTKTRLANKIATKTLGWNPRHVATLLVFPEDSTARRIARSVAGRWIRPFLPEVARSEAGCGTRPGRCVGSGSCQMSNLAVFLGSDRRLTALDPSAELFASAGNQR